MFQCWIYNSYFYCVAGIVSQYTKNGSKQKESQIYPENSRQNEKIKVSIMVTFTHSIMSAI